MAMSSFHRPRVYRSIGGCCICRAKSSSSRFTTSDKYENVFQACFRLPSACPRRSGEICNACVLLVKRYQKLPNNSTRHWAHVVDARAGPGVKNFVKVYIIFLKAYPAQRNLKVRRRESCRERTLKRKHVFRRQKRESSSISSDEAVLSDHSGSQLTSASALKADSRVSDFIDLSFWKRKEICCGTIFVGPNGETATLETNFESFIKDFSPPRRGNCGPSAPKSLPETAQDSTSPGVALLHPHHREHDRHRAEGDHRQFFSYYYIADIYFCPLQLLDRKDRKDVICPLTPSTTSSDSSSPVPSSSEEGGLEVEEVVTFLPKSSLVPNNLNSGNLPGKPIIAATANKYLVF